jgi:hypothetical protein
VSAPLANPLVQHTEGYSPLLVMVVVVGIVLTVATQRSPRSKPSRASRSADGPLESWTGRLSAPQMVSRAVAVGLLVLAVVAGRIGSTSQLRNIAPALVIGAAWPLLLLGTALLGTLWRWVDPWDGLARLLGRRAAVEGAPAEEGGSPPDVWPAMVPALLWTGYLTVYPGTLDPRSVGAALAIYTIGTVAGCLAFGRERWLSRVEVFGLLYAWTGRLREWRLRTWRPPKGAEMVLGVLAGGLLFGALRRSPLWGSLNVVPLATIYAAVGFGWCCVVGGGLLWALGRWSDRIGAAGAVAAASVPAVASLAVAFGMAQNRLFTSLQLLPALASDPFGFGWNMFGTADWGLNPDPLGHVGRPLLQLLVVLAGHAAGASVLAHRLALRDRRSATIGLGALAAAAAWAVTVT